MFVYNNTRILQANINNIPKRYLAGQVYLYFEKYANTL